MSVCRLALVVIRHVRELATFVVEGHLYATDDGRQFYVFTAGDATMWSAAEVGHNSSRFGRYLVASAESRAACVDRLTAVLEASGS